MNGDETKMDKGQGPIIQESQMSNAQPFSHLGAPPFSDDSNQDDSMVSDQFKMKNTRQHSLTP